MRKLRMFYFRGLWMICIAMMIVGTTLVPVANANNTNYYVDCLAGSNGSGTIGSPWNTLTSVNSHAAFQPGDQILLKRGTACPGQLAPQGSGSSGNPITIDAYGTGAAPIINGGGTASNTGAVYLLNQQYWVIQNLEVTNISSDLTTTRAGIMVFLNNNGGTANHIRILNNYVHDVDSKVDYQVSGGIVLRSFQSTGVDSFNDVVVQNNTVTNVGRSGITFWDGSWTGAGQASTNVIIKENVVSHTEGDNIVVFGTDGALIDHNTGSNGGLSSSVAYAVGIWFTRAFNTTMQYNEAYSMQANSGADDSEGFDVDLSSVNGIVQYNYSHDNAGGGYLICGGSDPAASVDSANITVRYNISQNDGFHGALTFSCPKFVPNMEVYNNTFYLGSGTTAPVINYYQSFSNPNQSWSFKNNIVYNLGSGGYSLPGTGGVFDYNVFFGNHPVSEPSDAHKLTTDPLLVAPGTGGNGRNTVDGYKLRTNSPALGSGVLISGNGGFDYWGNTVSNSTAPNRGAYNGAGITATPIKYEAEVLPVAASSGDTILTYSDVLASGGATVRYLSDALNDYLTLTINVPQPGYYKVKVGHRVAAGRAKVQHLIDGVNQGGVIDLYQATPDFLQYDLGFVSIGSAGNHSFQFKAVGINPSSLNYNMFPDYIELTPAFETTYEAEALSVAASSGDTQSTLTDAGASGGMTDVYFSNALNDYITMNVNVPLSGTYNVKVKHRVAPGRAKVQLAIDGTNQGSVIDPYSAVPGYQEYNLGSVTFTSTGNHLFKFTAVGQNASSTSWNIYADYIKLTPAP